jgi:hypothetical protein
MLVVLPVPPSPLGSIALVEEVESARRFAGKAHSKGTAGARQRDFASLSGWCSTRGLDPFPASHEVVAAYIMDLAVAGKKAGATTSSSVVHKEKGP